MFLFLINSSGFTNSFTPSAEGFPISSAGFRQTIGHATDSKSGNPAKGPAYLPPPNLSWSGSGIMAVTLVQKGWRVTRTSLQRKQDKTGKSLACLSWLRSHVVVCETPMLIFFPCLNRLLVRRRKGNVYNGLKPLKEKSETLFINTVMPLGFEEVWSNDESKVVPGRLATAISSTGRPQ